MGSSDGWLNWRLRSAGDLPARANQTSVLYRRPTANSGRWASRAKSTLLRTTSLRAAWLRPKQTDVVPGKGQFRSRFPQSAQLRLSDNDFSGSSQPTPTSSQRNTSGRAGWKRLGPVVAMRSRSLGRRGFRMLVMSRIRHAATRAGYNRLINPCWHRRNRDRRQRRGGRATAKMAGGIRSPLQLARGATLPFLHGSPRNHPQRDGGQGQP